MLKKIGISALVALMTLGTLSITEAVSSNDNRNTLGCRGVYCYNQNCNDNYDENNGYCNGGYCCGNGHGRGCW